MRNSKPHPQSLRSFIGPERFDFDEFLLNRKLLNFAEYYLYSPSGEALFYIDRPSRTLKKEFGVYLDITKATKVLSLNQDSAWSWMNHSFTLFDEAEQPIGHLRRDGWASMLRRTWDVYDGGNQLVTQAIEDSWGKAIFRRCFGGSIFSLVFLTNFIIVRPDGTKLGDYIRRRTVTDKHAMDMSGDRMRTLDRRLVVALAILLDNVEQA